MPSLYSKIIKLSCTDWWLLTKAVFWTGIGRILILFVPLKRFSFLLGTHMKETPGTSVTGDIEMLRTVGKAISRASRYVPWRCKCYEQAIAAKLILSGRGFQSTLY